MEVLIAVLLFLILFAIAPGIVEGLFQIAWFLVKIALALGLAFFGVIFVLAAVG